jgi:hypothetical protein
MLKSRIAMRRASLLLLILIVLGGCQPKSDPKVQARALLQSFNHQDWKALFALCALPEDQKALTDADRFAAHFGKGFDESAGPEGKKMLESMSNVVIGEPAIDGNRATVPTSFTVTVQGKSKDFHGVANLIQDEGVWKWDLSSSHDFEKSIGEQLKQLFGL